MILNENVAAVVTGAASGLGAGTVAMLRAKGVKVAALDMNEEAGKRLAAESGARFFKVDVTNHQSVKEALALARADHGPERLVVNCAGIAPAAKTVSRGEPHDPSLFQRVIDINLVGSFNVTSLAAAAMIESDPMGDDQERGLIVNTASVAAYEGQIGQLAYSASKGGIVGMTLPLARDLAKYGVRAMAIAPGIFGTPMLAAMPQEVQDSLAASVPYPSRLGTPEDYASLVCHMAENTMLNGSVIRLDGAIRMSPR